MKNDIYYLGISMNKQCKKKICGLIVTYNRKEYLIKTVKAVLCQTIALDELIIFDNDSNDGTCELITDYLGGETKKRINSVEVVYYRNKINIGGSGGFCFGIKMAASKKCDFVWIMDDDVYPETNCLEQLIKHMSGSVRICIPSRSDDYFQDYAVVDIDMTNPFKYSLKSIKKQIPTSRIKEDIIPVVDIPFEGPLISVDLINEIGLPNKDLFIQFDDTDYANRASEVTTILMCKNAIMHKQIIRSNKKRSLMGWRDYYSYRNQVWFYKKYGKNWFVRNLRPILRICDLAIRSIVLGKWSNLTVIKRAYHDGYSNVMGKTVDPEDAFLNKCKSL